MSLWDYYLTLCMLYRDPMAYELYRTLFRKASIPYVQMLRRWTTTGHLKDPYDELIVKEKKSTQLPDVDFIDEYWEKRYTVRVSDWKVCVCPNIDPRKNLA